MSTIGPNVPQSNPQLNQPQANPQFLKIGDKTFRLRIGGEVITDPVLVAKMQKLIDKVGVGNQSLSAHIKSLGEQHRVSQGSTGSPVKIHFDQNGPHIEHAGGKTALKLSEQKYANSPEDINKARLEMKVQEFKSQAVFFRKYGTHLQNQNNLTEANTSLKEALRKVGFEWPPGKAILNSGGILTKEAKQLTTKNVGSNSEPSEGRLTADQIRFLDGYHADMPDGLAKDAIKLILERAQNQEKLEKMSAPPIEMEEVSPSQQVEMEEVKLPPQLPPKPEHLKQKNFSQQEVVEQKPTEKPPVPPKPNTPLKPPKNPQSLSFSKPPLIQTERKPPQPTQQLTAEFTEGKKKPSYQTSTSAKPLFTPKFSIQKPSTISNQPPQTEQPVKREFPKKDLPPIPQKRDSVPSNNQPFPQIEETSVQPSPTSESPGIEKGAQPIDTESFEILEQPPTPQEMEEMVSLQENILTKQTERPEMPSASTPSAPLQERENDEINAENNVKKLKDVNQHLERVENEQLTPNKLQVPSNLPPPPTIPKSPSTILQDMPDVLPSSVIENKSKALNESKEKLNKIKEEHTEFVFPDDFEICKSGTDEECKALAKRLSQLTNLTTKQQDMLKQIGIKETIEGSDRENLEKLLALGKRVGDDTIGGYREQLKIVKSQTEELKNLKEKQSDLSIKMKKTIEKTNMGQKELETTKQQQAELEKLNKLSGEELKKDISQLNTSERSALLRRLKANNEVPMTEEKRKEVIQSIEDVQSGKRTEHAVQKLMEGDTQISKDLCFSVRPLLSPKTLFNEIVKQLKSEKIDQKHKENLNKFIKDWAEKNSETKDYKDVQEILSRADVKLEVVSKKELKVFTEAGNQTIDDISKELKKSRLGNEKRYNETVQNITNDLLHATSFLYGQLSEDSFSPKWGDTQSPEFQKIAQFSSKLGQFVQKAILSFDTEESIRRGIKFYINLAENSLKKGNMLVTQAINGALNSPVIQEFCKECGIDKDSDYTRKLEQLNAVVGIGEKRVQQMEQTLQDKQVRLPHPFGLQQSIIQRMEKLSNQPQSTTNDEELNFNALHDLGQVSEKFTRLIKVPNSSEKQTTNIVLTIMKETITDSQLDLDKDLRLETLSFNALDEKQRAKADKLSNGELGSTQQKPVLEYLVRKTKSERTQVLHNEKPILADMKQNKNMIRDYVVQQLVKTAQEQGFQTQSKDSDVILGELIKWVAQDLEARKDLKEAASFAGKITGMDGSSTTPSEMKEMMQFLSKYEGQEVKSFKESIEKLIPLREKTKRATDANTKWKEMLKEAK